MKQIEQIKRVQLAIDYVQRIPNVQKELSRVGFKPTDVTQGKALVAKVQMLDAAQQKEYGNRYRATDELSYARQQARAYYMRHLETARLALKYQRGHWKTLAMDGGRKTNLFGWLAQARTFYQNASLVKAELSQYNLTEAELQQGASMIDAVIDAYNVRLREDVKAQAATLQRNEALAELKVWMRRFTMSARLAFAEDVNTLRGLGLASSVRV